MTTSILLMIGCLHGGLTSTKSLWRRRTPNTIGRRAHGLNIWPIATSRLGIDLQIAFLDQFLKVQRPKLSPLVDGGIAWWVLEVINRIELKKPLYISEDEVFLERSILFIGFHGDMRLLLDILVFCIILIRLLSF